MPISKRDKILRHSVFLDRLKKGFANKTLLPVKQLEKAVIAAIEDKKKAKAIINKGLKGVSDIATGLAKDVLDYEYEFLNKLAKKKKEIETDVKDVLMKTTINKKALPISKTYDKFTAYTKKQYLQTINDADALELDDGEIIENIKETTKGRINYANLALAGLLIGATANHVRNQYFEKVDWVLDLELNNCPDCEERAADSPYNRDDVEGDIPVHANCGCQLVPTDDEEF